MILYVYTVNLYGMIHTACHRCFGKPLLAYIVNYDAVSTRLGLDLHMFWRSILHLERQYFLRLFIHSTSQKAKWLQSAGFIPSCPVSLLYTDQGTQ